MPNGQQIDSATGTLDDSRFIPLKSRKAGTGAATQALLGSAVSAVQGAFGAGQRLTGSALASAQGALTALAPAAWTSYPSLIYTEGVSTQSSPINLGSYVSGYNALTDVFQLVGGPLWLLLNGNLLYANGTQVDGDDTTVNIGVSRSGGDYVYTGALSVTVVVPGSGAATWSELMPMIYNANTTETSAQFKQYLKSDIVNNYAEWQALEALAEDATSWTIMGTGVWGGFMAFPVDDETGYVVMIPG